MTLETLRSLQYLKKILVNLYIPSRLKQLKKNTAVGYQKVIAMSREIFEKVDISLRSPKADWFNYLNTDKGKEWKFWWDNIRSKEIEQFIKRWSMDRDMQNRSLFPSDKYCLTCNK